MKLSSQNKNIFSIRKTSLGILSVTVGIVFSATTTYANETSQADTAIFQNNPSLIKDESITSTTETTIISNLEENDSVSTTSSAFPEISANNLKLSDHSSTAPNTPHDDTTPQITSLNVKTQFGALGDGISDDRQALQDAIDAANQGLGGGIVYIPEGTYKVDEILFLKSNIEIQLHDNATILNNINQKNHPSIVFMTGEFTDDGKQVEWAPTENIKFSGGTIDMNGQLNSDKSKALNLPLINSSGAFAIGYSSNFTISNVTFKNSYKGHAIQIAGSKNVLIDNSRFIGQALPNTLKDSQIISYETIQIEPQTRKGFPYALNNTGVPSENVTIQNSYFGKSNEAGELVTAIGTHYQDNTTQNPRNIKIINNHFDNMMYAGVRFTGFTDVLIEGNKFTKKSKEASVHYRDNGATLVNGYSYNNKDKTHVLDLNKHITVNNNIFDISDNNTKFAKDNAENLGDIKDITITNNTITYNTTESKQPAIQTLRIVDNLSIKGNTILSGFRGIHLEETSGNISVSNNTLYNLTDTYVLVKNSGKNKNLNFQTRGDGTLEINTDISNYIISAKPNPQSVYSGQFSDSDLKDKVSNLAKTIVSLSSKDSVNSIYLFESTPKDNVDVLTSKGKSVTIESLPTIEEKIFL
ncbi:TPA: right-handed parallel beta-helix repeat-containing protein [Streptococcus suis]|nr:right-handed parallel beta-helix repeat-containing protein [Streptococcus suis]